MLTVTEAALDRLSRKLVHRNATDDVALRFTRKTGGWKLCPDHARPTDKTFTHDGKDVLVLDETVSRAMADMTLDVKETEAGPRVTLR